MNGADIVDLLARTGVVLTGYTEPTTMALLRPVGAKLKISGREYTLPASFTLKRPMETNRQHYYTAELHIPCHDGVLETLVEMTLYAYRDPAGGESINTIHLTPNHIEELHAGNMVTLCDKTTDGGLKYMITIHKKYPKPEKI